MECSMNTAVQILIFADKQRTFCSSCAIGFTPQYRSVSMETSSSPLPTLSDNSCGHKIHVTKYMKPTIESIRISAFTTCICKIKFRVTKTVKMQKIATFLPLFHLIVSGYRQVVQVWVLQSELSTFLCMSRSEKVRCWTEIKPSDDRAINKHIPGN